MKNKGTYLENLIRGVHEQGELRVGKMAFDAQASIGNVQEWVKWLSAHDIFLETDTGSLNGCREFIFKSRFRYRAAHQWHAELTTAKTLFNHSKQLDEVFNCLKGPKPDGSTGSSVISPSGLCSMLTEHKYFSKLYSPKDSVDTNFRKFLGGLGTGIRLVATSAGKEDDIVIISPFVDLPYFDKQVLDLATEEKVYSGLTLKNFLSRIGADKYPAGEQVTQMYLWLGAKNAVAHSSIGEDPNTDYVLIDPAPSNEVYMQHKALMAEFLKPEKTLKQLLQELENDEA